MDIKIIKENKKRFLDLLLLADEQESMIDKYIERGELFALYDGDLKCICVITREDKDTCELKNIATYEKYQGKGYGSRLIKYICEHYEDKCKSIIVGTGDSPWIISFYERCGFVLSHRVKDFFIDNYEHPMFDNGIRLVDMVYLRKNFEAHDG
ncbi:GNAT family N-acetyltransferase [Anoxynatronum sibiricum]|uniref:GNAT family N-acetyltransferase n=1 Tax=Anoxynatronum sibiricum TaxID=210623 RepID=A0ABU9VXS4_9CLOT